MTLQESILLVREKFLEEQKGITESPTGETYKMACEKYPSMMTVAHYIWARELTKELP